MRLHRFYIETPISGETFDVSDRDLVHQWKKVFRYNVGSQVIVFDGSGTDYTCLISSLRGLGATLSVIRTVHVSTDHRNGVTLCVGLIKKDNFELVVQKATELGVATIIPILCEHSEKKKINIERARKIAVEASEQSGRPDIPEIREATTLADLFLKGSLPQEKIVFHPSGISWRQYRDSAGLGTQTVSFSAFIGPEGGFSDKEIALFKTYNVAIVSLGSQILRAETAAIAVSSLLLL